MIISTIQSMQSSHRVEDKHVLILGNNYYLLVYIDKNIFPCPLVPFDPSWLACPGWSVSLLSCSDYPVQATLPYFSGLVVLSLLSYPSYSVTAVLLSWLPRFSCPSCPVFAVMSGQPVLAVLGCPCMAALVVSYLHSSC
jgi:hypothetical protein